MLEDFQYVMVEGLLQWLIQTGTVQDYYFPSINISLIIVRYTEDPIMH